MGILTILSHIITIKSCDTKELETGKVLIFTPCNAKQKLDNLLEANRIFKKSSIQSLELKFDKTITSCHDYSLNYHLM